VFQSWSGAVVQNASAASTAITMPAGNATVTAQYSTPQPVPYPVSSHPRLWITPSDVPRLRSWATSSNPVYQNGLLPVLTQMVNAYTTQYFPNGTIASSGLYTAPSAVPPSAGTQVIATSVANPQAKGIGYLEILGTGPTLVSAMPNPLPVGTITVTIQGSGFQAGAVVFSTWGSNNAIALTTTAVGATSISANGYQGQATSATLTVRNPGSIRQ